MIGTCVYFPNLGYGNLMIVFKNYVLKLDDSCARTDLTTIWPGTTPFLLKEETKAPKVEIP